MGLDVYVYAGEYLVCHKSKNDSSLKCPSCDKIYDIGAKFCQDDGTKLKMAIKYKNFDNLFENSNIRDNELTEKFTELSLSSYRNSDDLIEILIPHGMKWHDESEILTLHEISNVKFTKEIIDELIRQVGYASVEIKTGLISNLSY